MAIATSTFYVLCVPIVSNINITSHPTNSNINPCDRTIQASILLNFAQASDILKTM